MYHSIHARGENVEDVIKAMEAKGEQVDSRGEVLAGGPTTTEANGATEEDLEDGELEEDSQSIKHAKGLEEETSVSNPPGRRSND